MKRSGNIGAAKNMDSVFANYTDEELEQDLIFDEDDQLVEIVEGYTEEGNTIFEEDEEIMRIADEIMKSDNDGDSPAEVRKDMETILGPDSKTDKDIKDIEDVEDTKLDDSQTLNNLEKNGESEADKELGLDKLEKEYHSSATVEEAFSKWINENGGDLGDEKKAEGTEENFGPSIDNTKISDDLKNEEDENYQKTADASVKENAGDLGDETKAEGTDTVFGNNEFDNTLPSKDLSPDQDENHNATNDASVKEDFSWLVEGTCDCGKEDCPICNPKSDLAPEGAPVSDTTGSERHEESNGETISDGQGEGIAVKGQVDDNSTPKPDEMTPDCSPKADNGDIMDDGCKADEGEKVEDTVEPEIEKDKATDAPVTDTTDDASIDEAFSKWLNETSDNEGDPSSSDGSESTSSAPDSNADESCGSTKECGDGSTGINVPGTGIDNIASVKAENAVSGGDDPEVEDNDPNTKADEDKSLDEAFEKWLNETSETEIPCPEAEEHLTEPIANKGEEIENPETKIDKETPEEVSKGLNEAEEADAEDLTKSEINAGASAEAEDTESELDDDLAALADAPEGGDADLDYDPSDEDLIDLAGGED